MKPMTATEVLARQKAHAAIHDPRIKRAGERLAEALYGPFVDKVIKDLKLGEKK